MSTIYPFRPMRSVRSGERPADGKVLPGRFREQCLSDEQALRELLEILKQPFQSHCNACRGSGIVSETGKSCETCHGTGRILIDLL